MKRWNQPIESAPISNAISTGITYGVQYPGIFPAELEVREAARYCGYNFTEWETLESEEQAKGIAHFRLHIMTDLHGNDAVSREMKRKSEAQRH